MMSRLVSMYEQVCMERSMYSLVWSAKLNCARLCDKRKAMPFLSRFHRRTDGNEEGGWRAAEGVVVGRGMLGNDSMKKLSNLTFLVKMEGAFSSAKITVLDEVWPLVAITTGSVYSAN